MLHILTSDAILARPDFLGVAESLLQTVGPNGALHLRSRAMNGRSYAALAQHLAATSRATGALLVINSRVDIAVSTNTPAVQLGRGALPIADVRRIAPTLRVGVSVHSVTDSRAAAAGHPDWIIAGHIYQTATHPGLQGRGIPFLEAIVESAQCPVIAVGGIRVEHVVAIRRAGAAGVAVISGVWDESDPKEATIRYLSAYDDRGN